MERLRGLLLPVPDYVAFDLETTGLSPETDAVLEVAMVRFAGGEVAERWSSLVDPGRPVPLKAARLTHIDPRELAGSPTLLDLVPKIQEFRRDLPLVGHNSSFDAAFLQRVIDGFPGVPLYDTLELSRIAIPGFKSYKLSDLAREMGVPVSEAHRAYDDAEVSGILFRLVQSAIADIPLGIRELILQVMGKEWMAARLFLVPGLMGTQPELLREPSPFRDVRAVTNAAGPPSVNIPGPVGKAELKERIAQALSSREQITAVDLCLSGDAASGAVEAALDHASRLGLRVLLAGFPEPVLPESVVRGGRPSDFVCLMRLEEAASCARRGDYGFLELDQRRFLAMVLRWSKVSRTGRFSEIQLGSVGHDMVPEFSCPSPMDCRNSCPRAWDCFYLKSEAEKDDRGGSGGVAHSLSLRSALTAAGAVDVAVVWSSHELSRAYCAEEPRVDLTRLREATKELGLHRKMASLDALLESARADSSKGGLGSSKTLSLARESARELASAARELRSARQPAMAEGRPFGVDPPLLLKDLHWLESSAGALESIASCPGGGGNTEVPLVEQGYSDDGERSLVLAKRSVWPGREALRHLSGLSRKLVLLSDSYARLWRSSAARRSAGLEEGASLMDLSSLLGPSSRESASVLLAVPDISRPLGAGDHPALLARLIVGLAGEVRDGVLVLFPSKALLRDTYALVQPVLEERGVAVYGQTLDGGSRVQDYLGEPDSVVMALSANVPADGDPVPRCLVVSKIQFSPPNPLDALRRAEVSSWGENGFVEVNVKPAAFALRRRIQAMLRSGGQRAVVIADPKVLPGKSSWGRDFMAEFEDLPKLLCLESELVARVSSHLRRQSS